jgi:hypothetical protein
MLSMWARSILVTTFRVWTRMAEENPIFAEIEALLAERDKPGLDRLEDTLTSGYAAALALEAERWRIERRISEVAALLGEGQQSGGTKEIVGLAERLNVADADLARLRGMLARLRDRTDAARAAA